VHRQAPDGEVRGVMPLAGARVSETPCYCEFEVAPLVAAVGDEALRGYRLQALDADEYARWMAALREASTHEAEDAPVAGAARDEAVLRTLFPTLDAARGCGRLCAPDALRRVMDTEMAQSRGLGLAVRGDGGGGAAEDDDSLSYGAAARFALQWVRYPGGGIACVAAEDGGAMGGNGGAATGAAAVGAACDLTGGGGGAALAAAPAAALPPAAAAAAAAPGAFLELEVSGIPRGWPQAGRMGRYRLCAAAPAAAGAPQRVAAVFEQQHVRAGARGGRSYLSYVPRPRRDGGAALVSGSLAGDTDSIVG
jgi:hypothetical protein